MSDRFKAVLENADDVLGYWPLQGDALDHSGNGHHGTVVDGEFVPGDGVTAGLALDGFRGFMTTPLTTRRNFMSNPSAEVDAGFAEANGAATVTRSNTWASDGTWSFKTTTPGTNTYDGIVLGGKAIPTVSGDTWTASVKIRNSSGASRKFTLGGNYYLSGVFVDDMNELGPPVVGNTTVTIPTATEQIVTVTFPITQPWDGDSMSIYVTVMSTADAPISSTFYVDEVLIEKPAYTGEGSYQPSVGTFFPTRAQITSGDAGFVGTADASYSDLGCFASNTTRTFVAVMNHDTLPAVSSYTDVVMASEPDLFWKLDETSGTSLADASGNGHTGKLYANQVVGDTGFTLGFWEPLPANSTGKSIAIVSNNGTGFRADDYKPYQPGSKISLECWINKFDEAGFATTFSSAGNGGPRLGAPHTTWEMGDGGFMRFYPNVNTFPFGFVDWGPIGQPFPGGLAHMVCTYDDTTGIAEWWVNGVSQGQRGPFGFVLPEYAPVPLAFDTVTDTGEFQFGWRGNFDVPNSEVFGGLVDAIAVYERILTPDEIAAHHQAGDRELNGPLTNVYLTSARQLRLAIGVGGDTPASGGDVLSDDATHLVAVELNGTADTVKWWVDGALVRTTTGVAYNWDARTKFGIGRSAGALGGFWPGKASRVAVLNGSLSDAEHDDLYDALVPELAASSMSEAGVSRTLAVEAIGSEA